ncbi:hypothetical protein F4780DRAFT_222357 [Xylariomycetidae sp. FL0641]|nr:hypothetical protein F4780DRAFT_222357 [Xylariomycetidae sp. FL0641]
MAAMAPPRESPTTAGVVTSTISTPSTSTIGVLTPSSTVNPSPSSTPIPVASTVPPASAAVLATSSSSTTADANTASAGQKLGHDDGRAPEPSTSCSSTARAPSLLCLLGVGLVNNKAHSTPPSLPAPSLSSSHPLPSWQQAALVSFDIPLSPWPARSPPASMR